MNAGWCLCLPPATLNVILIICTCTRSPAPRPPPGPRPLRPWSVMHPVPPVSHVPPISHIRAQSWVAHCCRAQSWVAHCCMLPLVTLERSHGLPTAAVERSYGLPTAAVECSHGLPTAAVESSHGLPTAAVCCQLLLPGCCCHADMVEKLCSASEKKGFGFCVFVVGWRHGLQSTWYRLVYHSFLHPEGWPKALICCFK